MPIKKIFGMRFRDEELRQVASSIIHDAVAKHKRLVYFVNAHCVNVAARDKNYNKLLQTAPELYADGIGMAIAARILGSMLKHNINGTDLFPLLCELAASEGVPIAFFGAEPGVAEACREKMSSIFPGLKIVFTRHGFVTENEQNDLIKSINDSGAQVLFVARGVPLQELWIDSYKDKLEAPVLLGVGALFDFYSGRVRRAPPVLRNMGLEWIYRLYIEPARLFRRYVIGNPEFLLRTFKQRITGNKE